MQRTVTLLLTSFVAGLLLTGCPDKKVEKEEPAAPTAVDKSGAEEKAAAQDDEHGEEADEAHGEEADKRPAKKKKEKKEGAAPADKDQGGGW